MGYLIDPSRFTKELINLFDIRGKIKKLLINKLEIDVANIPRGKGSAISYFEVRQGKITLLRGLNNYELQLLGRLVFLPTKEGVAPGIYLDEYNYWDTINGLHAIKGMIGATTLAATKIYGGIIATADTGSRIELNGPASRLYMYDDADTLVGELYYGGGFTYLHLKDPTNPAEQHCVIHQFGIHAEDQLTRGSVKLDVDPDIGGELIIQTGIGGVSGYDIFKVDATHFYYDEGVATPYHFFCIDIPNKIFLIGDGTAINNNSSLEVVKEDINTRIRFATFSTTLAECPRIYFHKSHDGTLQTKTTTLDGENLGWHVFYGVDTGNNWEVGAVIKAIQNGAAGTRVPTDLILYTYTNAAENANQLVLYHDGNTGMGLAIPTVKLDVNGDIKCTSGLLSDMQGVIWTDSNTSPVAGVVAGSTLYQANIAIAPGEIKVRTYFVKRPWMKVIRATAEIMAAIVGTAEMRINVGAVDGSIQSTTNNVWTPKESTYNCAGLVNGTIYEILFYLRAIDAGPCSMRRPVIGWSVS